VRSIFFLDKGCLFFIRFKTLHHVASAAAHTAAKKEDKYRGRK
jgi:hypothetical protein